MKKLTRDAAIMYLELKKQAAIKNGKSENSSTVKALNRGINELLAGRAIAHVSDGNSKMGSIQSISTAACITCNKKAACYKYCYGLKGEKIFKDYEVNNLLNTFNFSLDPVAFKNDFIAKIKKNARAFRLNVSGDIVNAAWFKMIIEIAAARPDVTFLQHTKKYSIVNNYIKNGGRVPDNLIIQFSADNNIKMHNPYNFRIVKVFDKPADITEKNNIFICPCNRSARPWKCEQCAALKIGCYSETVKTLYLKKH